MLRNTYALLRGTELCSTDESHEKLDGHSAERSWKEFIRTAGCWTRRGSKLLSACKSLSCSENCTQPGTFPRLSHFFSSSGSGKPLGCSISITIYYPGLTMSPLENTLCVYFLPDMSIELIRFYKADRLKRVFKFQNRLGSSMKPPWAG